MKEDRRLKQRGVLRRYASKRRLGIEGRENGMRVGSRGGRKKGRLTGGARIFDGRQGRRVFSRWRVSSAAASE